MAGKRVAVAAATFVLYKSKFVLRTNWEVKVLVRVRGVKRAEVLWNKVLVAKDPDALW